MKCSRCSSKMLPSQSSCDVCNPFTDDDLALVLRERRGAMTARKTIGFVALFLGLSSMLGLFLVNLFFIIPVAIFCSVGARALEEARFYRQLPRYAELRAQRVQERRAQRVAA